MSDKTLGQINEDAYNAALEELPGYAPQLWSQAWQAAAEAVAAEVTSKAAINEQQFYSPMSPTTDKEQAVIDAARFMRNVLDDKGKGKTARECAIDCVMNAVEALDSEEE